MKDTKKRTNQDLIFARDFFYQENKIELAQKLQIELNKRQKELIEKVLNELDEYLLMNDVEDMEKPDIVEGIVKLLKHLLK